MVQLTTDCQICRRELTMDKLKLCYLSNDPDDIDFVCLDCMRQYGFENAEDRWDLFVSEFRLISHDDEEKEKKRKIMFSDKNEPKGF